MNKQALFHQSDSTLAFPIDESTIKIRLKADKMITLIMFI